MCTLSGLSHEMAISLAVIDTTYFVLRSELGAS